MAGNLTAMIASIFSGSAVTADPYYEYTTLLLPGNGTNGAQNNTFLDGSTNNFTITRNGNTTQGTFSPFSQTGWSNYFNGSNAYFSFAAQTDFAFGTGDFTIETFVNLQLTGATSQTIIDFRPNGVSGAYPTVNIGGGNFVYTANGATRIRSDVIIDTNRWYHLVVSRVGTTTRMFIDEVEQTQTYNDSTNYIVGASRPVIGIGGFNLTGLLNGYLSNFRILKGTGFTSVTVPTAPFATGTANQVLLTCQANRFIDSNTATTEKTITVTGSPSVVAFSPFNPTASWSAATYGGSGYFDGSGDYLTAPDNAALNLSGNFTVETWVYLANVTGEKCVFHNHTSDNNGIALNVNGAAPRILSGAGTWNIVLDSSITISANTWNHIAATRSGNTYTIWVNGVSGGTASSATNPTYSGGAQIGRFIAATPLAFNGYASNLRVVKGNAVYTSNFTPPTAPLTAITNTALLLNFTNAGIYDATSKNDLETVGNAQISTTQSKFGGSSISFDGTGDWLLIPDQPPQRIGTGNFTVEMWVYRNSSGTYGLAGKGTGTTGWLVSLNSSNQVVFTYGSSTITSSGTVSATTWTHIAVVREGTNTNQTKIYIGGSNDGTGTVSTDFNQTNSMYIGADRTGGSAANAYVQDVRITNYARYTANFTPPTAAFPTL
jgi:hypothetical protein